MKFLEGFSLVAFKMARSSVEIYSEVLESIMKIGRLVGLNILDRSYNLINVLALVTVVDIITYSMVTVYSCFVFYGDLEKLIFCLVTYGFAIQVRDQLMGFCDLSLVSTGRVKDASLLVELGKVR
jgi:hypothetical protein